jgi:hypothetical protein
MKLKSSNKKTYLFLGSLMLFAALLFVFKTTMVKKATKYPEPPKVENKKTELELIQISLSEKSYLKLKKKRDKALSVGILETNDSDYVPATITYGGINYRAEVRLKGDWTDHLENDKWSFRIKLKDNKTILGMRKFSVHRPEARGFINEWLYHKAIKTEKLIGLRYGFLEGIIHIKMENSSKHITKEVGIYAIEESFDKRTIESNGRKESIILKFSEEGFWSKVKSNKAIGDPSGVLWKRFMDFEVDYPITVFGEDKVLQDETMHKYFSLSKNLLGDLYAGNKSIDQVFDVKELALQNAILNLFGATHGLPIINVRFYYNPITSKLEPIAFDGNSGHLLEYYNHLSIVDQERDSVYLKELAYALNKVSKPEYLTNLLNSYKKELSFYKKELKEEYRWKILKVDNITQNQTILRDELKRLKNKYKLEDIALSIKKDEVESFDEIKISKPNSWQKKNITINQDKQNNNVFKLERASTKQASYVIVDSLETYINTSYKVTMRIKQGETGNAFGLRVQGVFPNRIDAIFNLEKGTLKGITNVGTFSNDGATIKKGKEDWYEVTVKVKPNTNTIKLVFGPTDLELPLIKWVSPTSKISNTFIDFSSIKIEELK